MKQLRNLLLIIPVILGVISCNTDDLKNDIDSLKDRVTNLEAQVQLFNENLNALRVLAEGGKTIQSYTYDETTDKYTVTLSDGSEIVLTQGTKGEATTPSITISEDGFWIINGETTTTKAEDCREPTGLRSLIRLAFTLSESHHTQTYRRRNGRTGRNSSQCANTFD